MTDRVEFVNYLADGEIDFYLIDKAIYEEVSAIIKKIKPDIYINDDIMTTPIGIDQGIPYAFLMSCAPTYLGKFHH